MPPAKPGASPRGTFFKSTDEQSNADPAFAAIPCPESAGGGGVAISGGLAQWRKRVFQALAPGVLGHVQ